MNLEKLTKTEFKDRDTNTTYEIPTILENDSMEEIETHVKKFLENQYAIFLSKEIRNKRFTIT
jgi:hypothetical protein